MENIAEGNWKLMTRTIDSIKWNKKKKSHHQSLLWLTTVSFDRTMFGQYKKEKKTQWCGNADRKKYKNQRKCYGDRPFSNEDGIWSRIESSGHKSHFLNFKKTQLNKNTSFCFSTKSRKRVRHYVKKIMFISNRAHTAPIKIPEKFNNLPERAPGHFCLDLFSTCVCALFFLTTHDRVTYTLQVITHHHLASHRKIVK